jgi:hypothetical protein
MGTDQGGMHKSLSPYLSTGVSPNGSTHPQREAPRLSTALSPPALRAFAEAFASSLIGGLLYCLVLTYIRPDQVEIALPRVLALSLTFGGFEMWRISRGRTLKSAKTCLFWTLAASLFVWWALGAAINSSPSNSHHENAPHFKQINQSRLALIAGNGHVDEG